MDYQMSKGLTHRTRDFMRDVLSQVEGLEGVDSGALSMLEYNYDMFIRQSDLLKEEDLVIRNVQGNLVANPRVKIVKDAQTQCLAILREFGLTLKSRTNVKAVTKDSEDSPLETFIKGKKETR